MLKFKVLTKKVLQTVQNYTKNVTYPFCDYSVGVLFTWYIGFNAKYAIYNDTLIIRAGKKTPRFLIPIGKDVFGAIKEIENYCIKNNFALKFIAVSEEMLEKLKELYSSDIKSRFNRDYSDYIYDFNEMLTFQGKKFSGQRNHINSFKKQYQNYTVENLLNVPKKEVLRFLKEYKTQYKGMKNNEKKEFKYTKELCLLLKKTELIGKLDKLVKQRWVNAFIFSKRLFYVDN